MRTSRPFVALFSLAALPALLAAQQPADPAARVDAIFARWNTSESPGCAVGVAHDGRSVFERAYGMADLEHNVPNDPRTIFEAGSVSKQFTAAAVVLLTLDGKLSLDDDVRKYLPEVPQYERPVLIRHMLNHTSGLRDWGSVAGISGWGRGARAHTHEHVLDIVSRQSALNFTPGHEYSYSNTGFNLLAILVDRVSGVPFSEFTQTRIFAPLGMESTQWRDDYTRIVKRRATAYSARQDGFATNRAIEDVHGNGGLLTTVGDLLIWNENLETGSVGGPRFLELMHEMGVLNSGRRIGYASGLMVGEYKGVPEVSHTGSTAGYRAFLARYPAQELSVALLCNVGNANPGGLGHQVADVFLGSAVRVAERPEPRPGVVIPAAQLTAKAGLYRSETTFEPIRLVVTDDELRVERGPALIPVSPTVFQAGDRRFTFEPSTNGRPVLRETDDGVETVYTPVAEFQPRAVELAAYVGEYHSDDAETTLRIQVVGDSLVARRRPAARLPLSPIYPDAFDSQLGMIRFIRDPAGRVVELSLRQSRVYDMRFRKR